MTASPAFNQRPAAPLGKQTRGNATAVISSVTTDGRFATVLVNDKVPGESGYSIPIGDGPWVQGCLGGSTTLNGAVSAGATTVVLASAAGYQVGDYFYLDYGSAVQEPVVIKTISTNTITCAALAHAHSNGVDIEPSSKGFAFFFNNPAGDGGSLCTVDLDLKRILSVSTDVSRVAPTPLYAAISDHAHSGLFNPTTGIVDPGPIITSGLASIPSTAPNIVSIPGGFNVAVFGGGTYSVSVTVDLDADGTTSNTSLNHIEVVAAPHAMALGPADSRWELHGTVPKINGTGIYTISAGALGVQIAYDIGIRYVGHDGSRSQVAVLSISPTAAEQLAELQFPASAIDPTTGYIVISDTGFYHTGQQFTLQSGISSLMRAKWAFLLGNTNVSPSIWMMADSAGSSQGYLLYWYSGYAGGTAGTLQIYKFTGGGLSLLATSALTYTNDTTNFHTLEFIASQPTSGTVSLIGMIDGNIAVQVIDSSSPYTSGYIAAQFRDTTATSYIDQKTIEIDISGSPSSASLKSQGSIVPNFAPGCSIVFGRSGAFTNSNVNIAVNAATIQFADGTTIPFNGIGVGIGGPQDTGITSVAGTWYCQIWLTLAVINQGTWGGLGFYISQTAPSATQALMPYLDGNIPILDSTATSTFPPTRNSVTFNGGASGSTGRIPG